MAKIGSPIKTCDKGLHKPSDRHGNYKSFIEEGFADSKSLVRNCSDIDYNPELTKGNYQFCDLQYSDDIIDYIDERASVFRTKTKDGKEKKLRSDAKLCACGILQVDSDYTSSLAPVDRLNLYHDAFELLQAKVKTYGCEIIAATVQVDEREHHLHYVAFDENFQLSHKLDSLPFKNWLNFEFPKLLKEKGWDIEPNEVGYDAEYAKSLDEEELKAYKSSCKEKKKKRPSYTQGEYKAMKEAEKYKREAERYQLSLENMQRKNADLQAENAELRLQNTEFEHGIEQKKDELKDLDLQKQAQELLTSQNTDEIRQAFIEGTRKTSNELSGAFKRLAERKEPVKPRQTARKLKDVSMRGFEFDDVFHVQEDDNRVLVKG